MCQPTWNRVAVKGLHFVLRLWHLRDEVAHALGALVRIPIPAHGRVGTIEIRQVVDARRGVVRRVVQTSEVVRCARRNLDAGCVELVFCFVFDQRCLGCGNWQGTYSSLVRLAMAWKGKGQG